MLKPTQLPKELFMVTYRTSWVDRDTGKPHENSQTLGPYKTKAAARGRKTAADKTFGSMNTPAQPHDRMQNTKYECEILVLSGSWQVVS